ncbi:MAG TPA: BsuBI/PstI family type II restriction endonuclease [Bordetella sp.]|uniref:BsuBI/PstI family type II restriction endonuclease n=1 Tax=Bordetella sp. TaxID=28081 RepID=UPI002ED49CDA
MKFPNLMSIRGIRTRLELLFPPGLEMRGNLVREMAAKTVFVFLYGGMVEGAENLLRPSHVYFFTEDQSHKLSDEDRQTWVDQSGKPGFRPTGKRWYADTTREPIRDETIKNGLLDIGAVGKIPGVAVTSSKPIYFLRKDFAELFDLDLTDDNLSGAMESWRQKHLSPAARARMALLSAGKVKANDEVLVSCPDGAIAKLAPGPSSVISKDVVEQFAVGFLTAPALLWLSESGEKVRYQDERAAQAFGLHIDQSKVLPDIILANVGETGEDTRLVFIEVVASDGPMSQARRDALLQYVAQSGFPKEQCQFGTAFEDRADSAFRKCLPQLAWGTFVWFRSEPNRLMWLHSEPFNMARLKTTNPS